MNRAICLILFACCGCVASLPQPEIVSSKVTVTTSGKEVTDFDSELIHRATLSSSDLDRISKFDRAQDSFDEFGKGVGLQLLSDLPTLSMRQGDILTAIGKKVIKQGDRLSVLKSQIVKSETSITFLRVGRVHKTLISIR